MALIYGDRGWTKLDKWCLGLAVFGIILWQIFRDPNVGIATALAVGIIGSFPTVVSVWKDPSRENRLAWTLFVVSCVFAIVAIPRWTFQDAAQPIVFLFIDAMVALVLYFRKFIRKFI